MIAQLSVECLRKLGTLYGHSSSLSKKPAVRWWLWASEGARLGVPARGVRASVGTGGEVPRG